jgi:hypothetical protein
MSEALTSQTPNAPVMPQGGTPLGSGSTPPAAPPTMAPAPGANGSPSPSLAPSVAPPVGSPTSPPARPEPPATPEPPPQQADSPWPEKFLRDGKPDAQALLNSYRELERSQFRRREDLRREVRTELERESVEGVPANPADYKYEPMILKDGRKLEIDTQNPLYQFFCTTAHDLKLPQGRFQQILEQYAAASLAGQPSWEQEATKLGEHAEQRLQRCGSWAKGNLSQTAYDIFATIPATAANIALFEEIMELSGAPRFAITQAGTPNSDALTMDDIRAMMADPKYWDNARRDQNHVNRVKAALRRLNAQGR